MSKAEDVEHLIDRIDRERFRTEWDRNFAVSANAGSGKTTAISARLAALARRPEASEVLSKTAVVTFTNKAAGQIGQRARAVLLAELTDAGATDLVPLDHLEGAFFGTIHSFCLLLAQRYGQNLGIHLNPTVVAEDDDAWWEEFIENDPMQFSALSVEQIDGFLRHVPIEDLFELARNIGADTAHRLLGRKPLAKPSAPSQAILEELLALPLKGSARKNIERSQIAAREWMDKFVGRGFLPPYKPSGSSEALVNLAGRWMAPLKHWLGEAAAVLAAELALRYRAFRLDRGIQTYADQVEGAMAVLRDRATLEAIRREGWRIILDEAQDTDAQQFAVLVEITRPVGAELGTWPDGGDAGPRPGHFCMVGDGQQAIYGARADIKNFLRHLSAFAREDGGELLRFRVTFRSPHQVVAWLNQGFPGAFGPERPHNLGIPPDVGVVAPLLQVAYQALETSPANESGAVSRFELALPERLPSAVEHWLVAEVRQLAKFFVAHGPAGVGAENWGEVVLLAPRNEWLGVARKILESHGLKVALQIRRQRQRENPAFAWMTGLLAAICDPDNSFEWFGVLREIFAVSDGLLAVELRERGMFQWDDPEVHPEPLRSALNTLRPFVLSVDDAALPLLRFVEKLANACGLPARLSMLDPGGVFEEELSRLLAEAGKFGAKGAGARAWLRQLLTVRDEGRPLGKPEPHAINLLTAHSAKGLEWPVVIPLGLWRKIGKPPEVGLRMIPSSDGELRVFLDGGSVPMDTQESRERERVRELVRLLYVTLTRVRRHLIIPWHQDFGGRTRAGSSFIELWANHGLLEGLSRLAEPAAAEVVQIESGTISHPEPRVFTESEIIQPAPLPKRVLPHQLGHKADVIRATRHEAAPMESSISLQAGDDAIEYGLWWHETLEFIPWLAEFEVIDEYLKEAIDRGAALGYGSRGTVELAALQRSEAWNRIREQRWSRLAELAVFAPIEVAAWVDGVVDLVLHDPGAEELWIVDWKTNRMRAGESEADCLERLSQEYRLQLQAYGSCLETFFPRHSIKLWIYGSAAGQWIEIPR